MNDNWIALGPNLLLEDEIISLHIQKSHLIITLDTNPDKFECKQIVLFFPGENGNERAKEVFDSICKLKNAHRIHLDEDVQFNPDIMKTFYGDKFDRELRERIDFERKQIKARHAKKVVKYVKELERLKAMYDKKT